MTLGVRSAIECSLHCKGNLYSCAGYRHERKMKYQLRCEVCLIYDVSGGGFTINPVNSTAIGMPTINKEAGEVKRKSFK